MATADMPSAAAARAMRTAISPRLAISRRCESATRPMLARDSRGRAGTRSDQQRCADDDLGVIGAEGSPSAAGTGFDSEPVMDLRVVPFAQQGRILERGLP